MLPRVLGVDGCRGGWVGAIPSGEACALVFAPTIDVLLARATERLGGPLEAVAVDIPIGLPDAGRRAADVGARALLGPRASTIFLAPARSALTATTHAEASAAHRAATGEGLSVQAFGILPKIREVDTLLAGRDDGPPLAEAHPELSFLALRDARRRAEAAEAGAEAEREDDSSPAGTGRRAAGQARASSGGRAPLAPKRTWAGAVARRGLLAGERLEPWTDDPAASRVAADDVLDAAACAWTALRLAAGTARSIPADPEVFSDGIPAAIRT